MTFLHPLFLWTLAGMSLPIAIHLLSRREGKIVRIGSLRHIEESNTSRFKSLRMNELWLLLARCLMIVWLAFFLSGAQCTSSLKTADEKWLVIEAGMHNDKAVTGLIDSLTSEGFDLRLLSPDLPPYDQNSPTAFVNYWALAEQLQKTEHDVVVLSYSFAHGFRHRRINKPSNVTWISVDPDNHEFIASAIQAGDSVKLRLGRSAPNQTSYDTRTTASTSEQWFALPSQTDSVKVQIKDTTTVYIASDQAFENDARVLWAALKALDGSSTSHIIEVQSPNADWNFLFTEQLQASTGNSVRLAPQPAEELIVQTDRSEWMITRRLTPEEAVESHLAAELAMLFEKQRDLNPEIHDIRSMPDEMLWAETQALAGTVVTAKSTSDLAVVMAALLLLTWIIERILALKKNL